MSSLRLLLLLPCFGLPGRRFVPGFIRGSGRAFGAGQRGERGRGRGSGTVGFSPRGTEGTSPASGRVARQLLRDLRARSSDLLRPVRDTEQSLNVSLQITLSQIIDVNERNQILTTYLWIRQMWRDTFFRWNKEDYGDLDTIRVPSGYVWRPDIILYNSVDQFSSPAETNVVVRHDGLVTWDSPAIVRTSCQLDVTFFPFDGQRCPLTFGSWTYSGHQVSVWPGSDGGQLADLVEDVEWAVLGMPAHRRLVRYGCCTEPYSEVTFTLVLKRRTAFYLYNLLLPCVLISSLAPLAFYLPPPSGEKVSLGITLLLGLSMFQLMVADIMPPADSAPLIGKYYMTTMTMITISTAMTILTMSIHYCGPEARPVPHWVKVVILGHLARALSVHELGESCRRGMESRVQVNCSHRSLGEGQEQRPGEEGGAEGVSGLTDPPRATTSRSPGREGFLGSCPHHWPQLAREVEFIASCVGGQRETQQRVREWRTVSRVVDRLFTWIFMFMVLAMSVVIVAQAL